MPHVYDHGGAVPQRTALRNALLTRLSVLKRPTMYLHAVSALPTPLAAMDEAADAYLSRAVGGRYPAVAVALGRGDAAPAGMPQSHARKTIEVAVYVMSAHGRDYVEGRLSGDVSAATVTNDPGIETMLEHVEELLLGRDLGVPGVSELRPVHEQEVWSGDDFTVWELLFTARVDRTINHNRLVTTLLAEIDARHEVEGADPDNPEAVSLTTLEAP